MHLQSTSQRFGHGCAGSCTSRECAGYCPFADRWFLHECAGSWMQAEVDVILWFVHGCAACRTHKHVGVTCRVGVVWRARAGHLMRREWTFCCIMGMDALATGCLQMDVWSTSIIFSMKFPCIILDFKSSWPPDIKQPPFHPNLKARSRIEY